MGRRTIKKKKQDVEEGERKVPACQKHPCAESQTNLTLVKKKHAVLNKGIKHVRHSRAYTVPYTHHRVGAVKYSQGPVLYNERVQGSHTGI